MQSLLDVVHLILVSIYLLTLVVLTIYAVHRYVQVYLYYKHVKNRPSPAGKFSRLPRITVQLPMYNERYVAERVIEATCQLNYPRELLQIQVLDDSTDDSAAIAKAACKRMRQQGHDVQYIHRTNRLGFKAGALENAMGAATGEFIAIFDADFVPPPEMLIGCIDYFMDSNVGCVQTRWGHLNRDQSMLTKAQAIFLDGHFMIEHTARNRSGRFINFNGTAGMWRRRAIEDAGGWQHDTLTEDVDLSYRAQIRGWRFVFLPDLVSPAELPPEIAAFKQQQHRWTKGSVQTARKLLPSIMRAPLPWWVKLEAFFHLSSTAVYVPAVVLSVLLFPTFVTPSSFLEPKSPLLWLAMMTLFSMITCSAGTFYVVSQREVGENWIRKILVIPLLMSLGMGISLINAIAVLEGLFGYQSDFIRTPKYGAGFRGARPDDWKRKAGSFKRKVNFLPLVELGLGFYLLACVIASLVFHKAQGTIPFLLIFMNGYLYVGSLTLYSQILSNRARKAATGQEIVEMRREAAEPEVMVA